MTRFTVEWTIILQHKKEIHGNSSHFLINYLNLMKQKVERIFH